LYARHLAWLHAKPNEPSTNQKGAKGRESKTRLQRREEMGLPVKMPEVEAYEHILGWFFEIGPAATGMAGNVPISYTEIMNWVTLTGIEITDFEVGALIKMSKQYCYQSYISENPHCEAPYAEEFEQEELTQMRESADKKLRSLF
jgi:hypothetical protein